MLLKVYKSRVWIMLFMLLPFIGNAQLPGLPPGWGFALNPTSATYAIPTTVAFNGVDALQAGDWVGAFFEDAGVLKCAGAFQWTGTGNVALVAFGNDALEPVKNGFADGELVRWKFYYTATSEEVCVNAYDALGAEFNWSNFITAVVASFGPSPVVTCPANITGVLSTAPAFALTGGLPAGGVYSGPGVSGGMFTPSVAGVGTHVITYTFTQFGCSNFCTFTIQVIPGTQTQVISYITGWNWLSFNVLPATPTAANVLANYTPSVQDVIKTQTGSAFWNGSMWFPPSFTINANNTYLFYSQKPAGSFNVNGNNVNVTSPISVNANGWTWIGYKLKTAKTPAVALASLSPFIAQDVVKGQTASAFWNGSLWFPPSFQLQPGKGYQLFNQGPAKTLVYPASDNMSSFSAVPSVPGNQFKAQPDWQPTPGLELNMNVFVQSASLNGVQVMNGLVGTFDVDTDQCRGVEPFFDGMAFLTVGFSSPEATAGKTFYYRVWNADNDVIYEIETTDTYVNNAFLTRDLILVPPIVSTSISGTVTNESTSEPLSGVEITATSLVKSFGKDEIPNWTPTPGLELNMNVFVQSATLTGVQIMNGLVGTFDVDTDQCRGVEPFFDGMAFLTVGFSSPEATAAKTFYYKVWNEIDEVIYEVEGTDVYVNNAFLTRDLILIPGFTPTVLVTFTAADGTYSFDDIPDGTYTVCTGVTVPTEDYIDECAEGTVTIPPSAVVDFALTPACADVVITGFPEAFDNLCVGTDFGYDFSGVVIENAASVEWVIDPVEAGGWVNSTFILFTDYVGDVTISVTGYATPPCEDATASLSFEVYPLPVFDCPEYGPFCEGDDIVALEGEGVYTYNDQPLVEFNPVTFGTYVLVYTVTNEFGCEASCDVVIVVNPLPIFDCPAYGPFCEGDDAVVFTEEGDFYYNDEPITGWDPSFPGTFMIHYVYTDLETGCSNDCMFTITVGTAPTVDAGFDMTVCEGDPVQLSATASNYGAVTWYTFNGAGSFSDDMILNPVYYPSMIDIFNGSVELCIYASPVNPCTVGAEDCLIVEFLPLPIAVCPDDIGVCITDDPFMYGGYLIDPAFLGAGEWPFTIEETNECGTDICTFYVTVFGLPEVTCPNSFTVFISQLPITLDAATPMGGEYSGDGVMGNDFLVFETGDYLITYTYTDIETGCTNFCTFVINVEPDPIPELVFANLQWPATANVCIPQNETIYAQVIIENGVLGEFGYEGLDVWIGVGETDVNPADFTIWYPASYAGISGYSGRAEYTAQIGGDLLEGTYYYASKFLFNDMYYYGGFDGGFWNGIDNVSGVLTVEDCEPPVCSIQWANVQWPPSGTITVGSDYTVYAQVYAEEFPGQPITGLSAWIGYSDEDVDPSLFTNWIPATFNTFSGNNSEYMANIGATIMEDGTYFYASRFQCEGNDFVYGGIGGFWNMNSGVLTVLPLDCPVECPEDFEVCENAAPFMLVGAEPIGGVYSGVGVMDGMFYPEVVGAGEHAITYTYDCGNGQIGVCDFLIIVKALPTYSYEVSDTEICFGEEITWTEYFTGTAPWTVEYLWNGELETFTTSETPSFTTEILEESGVYEPLSVTDGTGCVVLLNQPITITVNPLPWVQVSTDLTEVCLGEVITITTVGPEDGDYPFEIVVSVNGTQQPMTLNGPLGSMPFLAPEAGVYNIAVVSITSATGCIVYPEIEFTLTVLPLPVVECPEDFDICVNAEPFVFGDWTFDPSMYEPGVYEFTFTEENECGVAECTFYVTVIGLPVVVCPEDFDICENAEPFVFGDWTFDPSMYEPGVYEFTFTEENECGVNECTFYVTVIGLPVVVCPDDIAVCIDADPFEYGGEMIDPMALGVGVHEFVLTASNECGDVSCSYFITVNALPELTDVTLVVTEDGTNWMPVTGDLGMGYELCINPESDGYALNIASLMSDPALAEGYFGFYVSEYPAGYFEYWDGRGVNAGAAAGTWQEWMWWIINGNQPLFYIGNDDDGFMLVDGLQKDFASQITYLALPGDYPAGDYEFEGMVEDVNGCVSELIVVSMTFKSFPVIIEQPVDIAVTWGMSAEFSVVAENVETYQWYGPNGMIEGANGPTLTLEAVTLEDEGGYFVKVSNSCDPDVSSIAAYLTVSPWTQQIDFLGQVNGMSTYLDLTVADIATLMAPLGTNLQYVEFQQPNQVYVPGGQTFIWNEDKGAKVGIKAGGFPASIEVIGYPTLDSEFLLPAGWSIMPVRSLGTVEAEDVFESIEDKLIAAFSIDYSGMYWPQYNVYSLQYLVQGSAYLVALSSAGIVSFDVDLVKSAAPGYVSMPANTTTWKTVEMTGVQHNIAITTDALAQLAVGDVIGAFNQNGNIAGMLEITSLNENTAIRIYGNEFTSKSINGFTSGDMLSFKVYRNGEVIDLEATFDPNMPNTNVFAENGLSAIIALKAGVTAINDMSSNLNVNLYPNPAKDFVNVETNFEIRNVKVVNYVGQVVFDRDVDQISYQINTSNFGPGMYFVQIQTNDGVVVTKRLTVN